MVWKEEDVRLLILTKIEKQRPDFFSFLKQFFNSQKIRNDVQDSGHQASSARCLRGRKLGQESPVKVKTQLAALSSWAWGLGGMGEEGA